MSTPRRRAVETAVLDFGDQAMSVQFGEQPRNVSAALTLFNVVMAGSGYKWACRSLLRKPIKVCLPDKTAEKRVQSACVCRLRCSR